MQQGARLQCASGGYLLVEVVADAPGGESIHCIYTWPREFNSLKIFKLTPNHVIPSIPSKNVPFHVAGGAVLITLWIKAGRLRSYEFLPYRCDYKDSDKLITLMNQMLQSGSHKLSIMRLLLVSNVEIVHR